jgi:AraC family transcriptional regulator of adaptative response/methylated-DNA-[protein]-cysteine methyltransferase
MPSTGLSKSAEDYDRVELAIRYLDERSTDQPGLEDLSAYLGISEFHLQRVFSRWVGISPKRFLQFVTKERAKQMLKDSRSLLDVTYEVGLSSPSRLHELFVTCEALTPGEYKQRGAGLEISYGFHPTPFGECLIGSTRKGICWIGFTVDGDRDRQLSAMRRTWRTADFQQADGLTGDLIERIFGPLADDSAGPLHVYVQGTNFQIKVWEALLRIPAGAVATYGDVATVVGDPGASRAVGNAVGRNPVGYLIPCHRVIRGTGAFGHYQSGPLRKRAMLGWESARVESA